MPARALTPQAQTCLERYPTPARLMEVFAPTRQDVCTANLELAYTGHAPALVAVSQAYGQDTAEAWLMMQLVDLSEYSGCRDKLTTSQLEQIAAVVRREWGYMRLTELMHFFLRFKAGYYGRFYGAVDGLAITEALGDFARERRELHARFEREREHRERERERQEREATFERERREREEHGLTLGEWLLLKHPDTDFRFLNA